MEAPKTLDIGSSPLFRATMPVQSREACSGARIYQALSTHMPRLAKQSFAEQWWGVSAHLRGVPWRRQRIQTPGQARRPAPTYPSGWECTVSLHSNTTLKVQSGNMLSLVFGCLLRAATTAAHAVGWLSSHNWTGLVGHKGAMQLDARMGSGAFFVAKPAPKPGHPEGDSLPA